jgi:pyruvate-ferredoxin/flavodoxin oxidoreductase
MHGADQPLKLDSRKPTIPFEQFATKEGRFAMLAQADPERAKQLVKAAQADIDARWQYYEQVAGVHRTVPEGEEDAELEAGGQPPGAPPAAAAVAAEAAATPTARTEEVKQ